MWFEGRKQVNEPRFVLCRIICFITIPSKFKKENKRKNLISIKMTQSNYKSTQKWSTRWHASCEIMEKRSTKTCRKTTKHTDLGKIEDRNRQNDATLRTKTHTRDRKTSTKEIKRCKTPTKPPAAESTLSLWHSQVSEPFLCSSRIICFIIISSKCEKWKKREMKNLFFIFSSPSPPSLWAVMDANTKQEETFPSNYLCCWSGGNEPQRRVQTPSD